MSKDKKEQPPVPPKRSLKEKLSPKNVVVTFGTKKPKQDKEKVLEAIEPHAPTYVVTSPVDFPTEDDQKVASKPTQTASPTSQRAKPIGEKQTSSLPKIHYPESDYPESKASSTVPPISSQGEQVKASWESEMHATKAPMHPETKPIDDSMKSAQQKETGAGKNPPPPSGGDKGASASARPPASGGGGSGFATFLSLLALCGVGYLGYMAYQSDQKMHAILTQTDTDTATLQNVLQQSKQSLEQVANLKVKNQEENEALAQLKQQVQHAQSQLVDLRNNRDWVLAEVRYLLFMANERLKVAQDVPTAIIQLETAENRLKALADPGLLSTQSAIARDIAQLKLQPKVDREGIWTEIAAIKQKLTTLPFKQLQTPSADTQESNLAKAIAEKPFWQRALWQSWLQIKDLIRVTRLDANPITPALGLQAKSQILQSMQLMAEEAQWAVLQEKSVIYQKSLNNLYHSIQTYFQPSNEREQVEKQIQALMQDPVVKSDLNINESLQALSSALQKNVMGAAVLSPATASQEANVLRNNEAQQP